MRPKRFLTFILAAIVGLLYLGAIAQHANATGYGQAVVQQQKVVTQYVPQQVVVQEYVAVPAQVQAVNVYDPFLSSQFSTTNAFRIRQQQVLNSRVQSQALFNRSRQFNSFRSQSFTGGNVNSISIQRSRVGRGGFLRNLLPF